MAGAFGFDDLGVEVVLPMRWSPAEETRRSAPVSEYASRNLQLLRLLEMEEGSGGSLEGELVSSQELSRLEARLDLLIQLVGQLLPRQELPLRRVWLGVSGLGWSETVLPEIASGDVIDVQILLPSGVHLPLHLQLRVTRVQAEAQGWQIAGDYTDATRAELDALQRLVFRMHRREIARSRL